MIFNLNLEPLNNPYSKKFKETFEIYEEAFPGDERRDFKSQEKALSNKNYRFFSICENEKIVGMISEWEIGEVRLIEHFAIKKGLRNRGRGTQVMKEFLKKRGGILVIEIERPETEIAKRRINFYRRLGWKLNLHDYIQPAYSKDKNAVPMFLISYPNNISDKEFIEIRKKIHTKVYMCKSPILNV